MGEIMDVALAIVLGTVLIGAYVAVIVYAITQIRREPTLNGSERTLWIVAVIFFPLMAGFVWLLMGPHPLGLHIDQTRTPRS
jgi:O-antigen ligase